MGDAIRIPLAAIDRLIQAKVHDAKPAIVEVAVDVFSTLESCARSRRNSSRPSNSSREQIADFLKGQKERPRNESLLTVKEEAGLLSVSQHAVYGWAERGEGPPFTRMGRTLRFRPRDVLEWLEANRQEPPNWRVELESRGAQKHGSKDSKWSWRRSGSWPTPPGCSIPWACRDPRCAGGNG